MHVINLVHLLLCAYKAIKLNFVKFYFCKIFSIYYLMKPQFNFHIYIQILFKIFLKYFNCTYLKWLVAKCILSSISISKYFSATSNIYIYKLYTCFLYYYIRHININLIRSSAKIKSSIPPIKHSGLYIHISYYSLPNPKKTDSKRLTDDKTDILQVIEVRVVDWEK